MTMQPSVFSDSISYEQFKMMMVNVQVDNYSLVTDPAFKPALVLGATAMVNAMLFMNYNGNKPLLVHRTTIVFVVGGLLSVATYFLQ